MKKKGLREHFKVYASQLLLCVSLLASSLDAAAQTNARAVLNERVALEAVFANGESVWTLSDLKLPNGALREIEWRETDLYAPDAGLLEISVNGVQRHARSALRVFVGRSYQSHDGLGILVLRSDGRLQGSWDAAGTQFELRMEPSDSGIVTSPRAATNLAVNPFEDDQIPVPTQVGQPKSRSSGKRLPFSIAGRNFGKSLRLQGSVELPAAEPGQIHLSRLDAGLIEDGFRVELNGQRGDADLYVIDSSEGLPETYHCGPLLEGANEICVIRETSAAKEYLVAVHSVSETGPLNLHVGKIESLAAGEYYGATIAIDTDYEMVRNLGSVEDVQVYIASLFAYLNATYETEINTRLLIGDQIIPASAAQDPYGSWSGCQNRLFQVSSRFANIDTVNRALVAHFSPSGQNCGVAFNSSAMPGDDTFEGVLCDSEYGVSVNNVAAMAPGSSTPISSSWDAIVTAHEIGHNFSSPHSHCYGDLNGGGLSQSSNTVDACYTQESGSSNRCAAGTTGLPGVGTVFGGSPNQGNGVIMSYCHFLGGGLGNVGRTFGRNHEYGVMPARVAERMTRAISNASAKPNSCISVVSDSGGNKLTVSTEGNGGGSVTSDQPGINCGADCEQVFDSGLSVNLTATPQAGSFFSGWGGACGGTSSTCQVTMTGAKYVTATFTASAGITVVQPGVTVGPLSGSTSSNTDFVVEVPADTDSLEVRLAQGSGDPDIYVDPSFPPSTNAPGYDSGPYSACSSFNYEQDEYCKIENPEPGKYYIRVNGWEAYGGAYLTATVNQSFVVTPSTAEGGSIFPSAPQKVAAGGTTTFTITPDNGYQIGTVSGSCSGNLNGSNYTTAAITQNCTVEVTFEQNIATPQPPAITSVSAGDSHLTIAFETDPASPGVDSFTATCISAESKPAAVEHLHNAPLEGDRGLFEADRCGAAHVQKRPGRLQAMAPANTAANDCSIYNTTISSDYSPLSNGDYVIPVFWHVIYTSSGEGYLTEATINEQMQVLNNDFAAVFDTTIQFELAGITRTENSEWFTDSESDELAYKTALQRDPDRYLNIYTNDASGYLGYAYFPALSAGGIFDGVVMNHAYVGGRNLPGAYPYDQGRTLIHEVGHYLGLYHTFQGNGGQCANTLTSGDYIEDTWPHDTPDYGVTSATVCGGSSPIDNFMNYSVDRAMDRFSVQQSNRMICSLLNYRSALFGIQLNGSSSTGTASPLTVTGLTNGTTYQCSVTATNSSGTSAASATVFSTPTATSPATVTVTASASDGGTINPTGTQQVSFGSTLNFQLLPSAGYQISSVGGTCLGVLEADTFKTSEITADCSVKANFEPVPNNTYSVVSTSTGAGSIAPEGTQTVIAGSTLTYQLNPNSGHFIASVGGTCPGTRTGNAFVAGPINSDCSVVANFSPTSGSTFSVQFSASVGGTITPAGEQTVPALGVARISLSPNPGFTVGQIAGTCPEGSLSGGDDYTTGAISEDCSVLVSFSRAPAANGKISLNSVAFPGVDLAVGAPFWRLEVQPGQSLQGNIDVVTENIRAANDVVPLSYTWTWGNRRTDFVQVARDIPAGTSQRTVPIDLSAPATPGTYFLHFGFAGEYSSEQVLSASNWQAPLTWHDGNDFHDLSANTVLFSQANGFIPQWSYLGPAGYRDTDVAANSIEIKVTGSTHTVMPSSSAGGSISPSTSQTVETGASVNFTLTPDNGYQISEVGGTCPGTLSGSTYTAGAITADCTVVAGFETIPAPTYTVTPSAGTGGSISPSTSQTVESGASVSFTLIPDSGYQISEVGGTCTGTLSGNTYTTGAITVDCTVVASFSYAVLDQSYLPAYSLNGGVRDIDWQGNSFTAGVTGTLAQVDYPMWRNEELNLAPIQLKLLQLDSSGLIISESDALFIDIEAVPLWGSCNVNAGYDVCYTKMDVSSLNFTVTAGVKYAFVLTSERSNADWAHLNVACDDGSYAYTRGNAWAFNSTSHPPFVGYRWGERGSNCGFQTWVHPAPSNDTSHTVTPSSGTGGSISPSTSQTVETGASVNFTLTPDNGYQISEVGGTCPGTLSGSTYTAGAITADCTVVAGFKTIPAPTYTVTPSAGTGGSISPSTSQTVESGASVSFTLIPDSGYQISEVGGTCTGTLSGNTYTTGAITVDCTVVASFSVPTPAAFIERFYVNILGRPSDEAGLNAWLDVMNTQSASAVALGFLNSAEFKNRGLDDAAFVGVLYRTLFDREGDPAGVAYWLNELSSGRLRDMVIWGFLRAAEFKNLSDVFGVAALSAADESAYGIRAFVERFYTLVLGRQPDQGGFDNWVTALTNGSYAGGDIAKAFFLSAEYLNQNTTDSAFVETAYRAFFGREADPAGKEGWLNVLAIGRSREYVLDGFIGSAEFVALAASYGISASREGSASRGSDTYGGEVSKLDVANPIPVIPLLGLLIFGALVGLLGLRRFAYR